jgi:Reverse transcriptase (RNA-dependent DNA polymerase)
MVKSKRHNRYGNKRHYKQEHSPDNQVTNLSQVKLSRVQTAVLNKGLQFVPTTNKTCQEISETIEFERMARLIRLNFMFARHGTERDKTSFLVPSKYQPPMMGKHMDVERFLQSFRSELNQQVGNAINLNWTNFNFTRKECIALNTLKNHPQIVIKPADKGGGILVLDKEKYLNEGFRHLLRPQYYQPIPSSLKDDTAGLVKGLALDLFIGRHIDRKLCEFLLPPRDPKSRIIYFLPKAHKLKQDWPDPAMPAGRPIVANVSTELTNLSKWVDHWIQPLAQRMLKDSLVKDSYDFIDRLKNIVVSPGTPVVLIAADVKDLYTNIPHGNGIIAIIKALNATKNQNPVRPPTVFLVRALKLILEKNDMQFAGRHFLQKKGISMGTNSAPAIANIYMTRIDDCVRSFNPIAYYRFIDDLFIIWDKNRDDLQTMIDAVNTVDPNNLQLTFVMSNKTNTFLDVEVMITDRLVLEGKLDWKVFFKPTDTHQLLHRKSCHPPHTYRGLIKSQIIRYKRLCSQQEDFEWACKVLFQVLTKRGYHLTELLSIKTKVENLDTELQRQGNPKEPSLYLIIQWDARLRNLPRWIRDQWREYWDNNPHIQDRVPKQITTSWKRARNIREHVVRAAITR